MLTIGDLVEFKFGVGIYRVIHVNAKEIGICGSFATYFIALEKVSILIQQCKTTS